MSRAESWPAAAIGWRDGPPSATAQTRDIAVPPGSSHCVQFYEDDAFLTAAVARFLAAGLTAGQPIIVIAGRVHADAFIERLSSDGLDIDDARKRGQLTVLDASETLASFMRDGQPDPGLFRQAMGTVIERAMSGHPTTTLRLYGEMVDMLWKAGQTDAAIRLEEFWNDIGSQYDFSLLCAYEMANFYRSADAGRFEEICRQHSHVVPAESYVGVPDEARLVEISRLQQRARALEAEIAQREELELRLRDMLAAQRRAEGTLRQRERELSQALADAEAARERADEANSAKSEFLATMSHELRTPLNAIAGYVQLVELGIHGPVTDAQRMALGRAQKSQQHLLSLINDVLNFAKLEASRVEYRLEDVPLSEALADVACMVEPQLAAKVLAYTVDAASVVAYADREKLQQILLNLLSNAIKFTEPGGSVSVLVPERSEGRPGTVVLHVMDTGCGIAQEKHEMIFDPFVQVSARLNRAHEGTGLGLAISRELARGMGGDLSVRSEECRGSVFTLTLPAATAAS